jgi:hypothetical protein
MQIETQPNERIGDDKTYLYVDNETALIYQVKFLEDHVIARMACPTEMIMRRMTNDEFGGAFTEYLGAYTQVEEFLGLAAKTELL